MIMEMALPVWLGLPLAFAAAALFGLIIERVFFSRLVGESVFSMVMVTIGLLILIRGIILVVFGPQVRPFPIVFPIQPILIGDILIPRAFLYGGFITVVIGLGLSWFFNRTRAGLRMTAVAEDHEVAMSMGISVRRSIAFAWALGSVLSTLGAIVYLSGRSLNVLTSEIGMAALPVALLAGLESIGGLLIAGVLVGIVQALAMAYLDPLVGGAVGSVLPFIIMLIVLLVRPTGMFGWKTIERV
jgi:branched-chain amino acid transport system permease protein